jgi:hypothetical protein
MKISLKVMPGEHIASRAGWFEKLIARPINFC